MKKTFLIILFICLNMTLMAFAEEWVELYSKTYIKIDRSQKDKVFYWEKILNDGAMDRINNKKIQYVMNYAVEDCFKNSNGLLATYKYDISGNVLYSYVSRYYNYPDLLPYEPVVPQSVGEVIHNAVCNQ